jgi:hypothetical protein
LLGDNDGSLEGTLLGNKDGAWEGALEGEADGLVLGAPDGEIDGAGEGAAVGMPHMQGSSMATAAAVWISRHSRLVNSLFLPRVSNSPQLTPPIALGSLVGSPLKQTVQKTFFSPMVGAGVDGEAAGDKLGSFGQPQV